MDYSKIYRRFSEDLNNPDVLTNPAKYLGPNWENVLNFWIYLDSLSEQEIKEMDNLYWALDFNVRNSAWIVSRNVAAEVVGDKFRIVAWKAALNLWVFGTATEELIGDVEDKVAYDLIMSHKKS